MRKVTVFLVILCVGLFNFQAEAYESGGSLEQLQQFSDAFAELATKVTPGVVAIVSEKTVNVAAHDQFRGTPFEHFFGTPRRGQPREREFQQHGQGSGVIVRHSEEYYILTNNHVVRNADEIQVQMADDRYFDAEVVGTDSLSDLAVLKIDAGSLLAIPFGDSDALRVGEMVLAIGNPFGYEHSVTSGIVSALGRGRSVQEYGSFIQTDAAINLGNSGGALINLRGELIGINTAIVSRNGGYQGIGFSIPVNLVKDVMEQLIEHGEVRRGLLGVEIGNIDPITAEALGMENTQGVLINRVIADRAAGKAGVKRGDVVLAVDGELVRNATELKSLIGATLPGVRVELRILRDGREKKIKVTLDQLTEEVIASRSVDRTERDRLGLGVQELTPEIARQLGYEEEKGVLVSQVERGSEAARRGLRRGDLIQEVNHQPVDSVEDYEDALARVEPGEAVLLLIRRNGYTRFIGLRMSEE